MAEGEGKEEEEEGGEREERGKEEVTTTYLIQWSPNGVESNVDSSTISSQLD